MNTTEIISPPGGCDPDPKWIESNRALGRLIDLHRPMLGRVFKTAEKICRGMTSMHPMLDALCVLTCPSRPMSCCLFNKVWFDFNDLLFIHLTGQPLPPLQITMSPGEACDYLAHGGCLLPRLSRPWACTLYVCGARRRALKKTVRFKETELETSIQSIAAARQDMEAEFIRAITGRNRENGSESPSLAS